MTLKNQLCKICNQPDNYSEDCICSKCIKKWKEFHIEKGKSDERERICKIIDDYFIEQRRLGKGLGVVWEELKQKIEEKK